MPLTEPVPVPLTDPVLGAGAVGVGGDVEELVDGRGVGAVVEVTVGRRVVGTAPTGAVVEAGALGAVVGTGSPDVGGAVGSVVASPTVETTATVEVVVVGSSASLPCPSVAPHAAPNTTTSSRLPPHRARGPR